MGCAGCTTGWRLCTTSPPRQTGPSAATGLSMTHRRLRLASGDTVNELGTGSGYALPALSAAVGPTGRVVAVDISPWMLARVRARCQRLGLDNVELVQADIGSTACLKRRPPSCRPSLWR